jgi:endonuclease/exonuclease/phosphatase family metal-dependent hydrolase
MGHVTGRAGLMRTLSCAGATLAGLATLVVPATAGATSQTLAATSSASSTASSSRVLQPVRVMTYNILELSADGRHEGSGTVAPWSQRKAGAVRLIKAANPDVVAVQEGSDWVGRPRGHRQVDSLRAALGGAYALAHTEVSPNRPHYFRTGVYILYKKAEYRAYGHSWHWGLGNQRWAAYQLLKNRQTGAKFLFVSTHLLVGDGAANDQRRESETKVLISKAGAFARKHHVPVIYGGDFNSDHNRRHAFNGPAIAMHAANMTDTFNAAPTRSLGRYNSANEYDRRPPKFGDHIDYVFASPGVVVRSWRLVMDLSHGHLVGVIPSDHNPVVTNLAYPY